MNTVYVVTSGSYSDYGIEGIFSTRELAEEMVNRLSDADIDEWELDGRSNEVALTTYNADIHIDSGEVIVNQWSASVDPSAIEELTRPDDVFDMTYGREIRATSHKSEEHAIKLAVEARQAFLRERALRDGNDPYGVLTEAERQVQIEEMRQKIKELANAQAQGV